MVTLIKALLAYNKALKKTKYHEYKDLPNANKDVINQAVKLSLAFDLV